MSCCAVVRMGELLHNGGSASVKKVWCTFCQRHQGFGVSTLARLSHCTHSRVSTGLQQRWVIGVWQVVPSKSGVSVSVSDGCIIAMGPHKGAHR